MNNMGHLKWVSTLKQEDLESMKQLIKQAQERNKTEIYFQQRKYGISYINSIIRLKEELLLIN
jgi:hypothetical protein